MQYIYGVSKTDIPYDAGMAFDSNRYRILVFVDGHIPQCLTCEKLGHIRRDCKARECLFCLIIKKFPVFIDITMYEKV